MTTRFTIIVLSVGLLLGCGDSSSGTDSGPHLYDAGRDARTPDAPGIDASSAAACEIGFACDDGAYCNGSEACDPSSSDADSNGCVSTGSPCGDGLECDEATESCVECLRGGPADQDSDGYCATDCDDTDPRVNPDAEEQCDRASATASRDEDCDPSTVGPDEDEDGEAPSYCCNGADCGTDCDDTNASVAMSVSEICNSIDDDCDGTIDEGCPCMPGDERACGSEAHDGIGPCRLGIQRCSLGDWSACIGAVDPTDEVCGGTDEDCDGATDETAGLLYLDRDGDGFGAGTPITACAAEGYVPEAGDCDDRNALIYPGAPERCDGLNNDCVGGRWSGLMEDQDSDGHSPPGAACTGGFPKDDVDDFRACRVTASDDGDCEPCFWAARDDSRYLFCGPRMTEAEAHAFCFANGTNPMVLDGATEEAWVYAQVDQAWTASDRWWLGLRDVDTEGTWTTRGLNEGSYFNWAPGQPDNWMDIEHCAYLGDRHTRDGWNDLDCGGLSLVACEEKCTRVTGPGGDYLLCDGPRDVEGATLMCERVGGVLAEPANGEERDFLFTEGSLRRMSYHGFYLGYSDEASEGIWVSRSTGEVPAYLPPWSPGQPDDAGATGEDCVTLPFRNGVGMNDFPCDRVGPATLCEVPDRVELGGPVVLLTEVVEGSRNNKAVELTNIGGGTVDLSTCTLTRVTNGGAALEEVRLTGSLAGGATLVVCNPLSAVPLLGRCDQMRSEVQHNGNDGYRLECAGMADSFGADDGDPGSAWTGGGVTTLDRTLRRKCSVTAPDADMSSPFDPSVEWDEFPTDTFDQLGEHCP